MRASNCSDNHLLCQYINSHKPVITVNGEASHQPAQCERCINSCGYRVGCWLVSVPRTAAHSNAPLSSSWCLNAVYFFFQDGELVLERSTPCWMLQHLQKRHHENKIHRLTEFSIFFVFLSPFCSLFFFFFI